MFALAIILTMLLILSPFTCSVFTPSNPIFKAAYEGQLRVIRDYVSEGGSINAVDKWNNTALHWAAKGNQYNVMTFLVENGVDVDAENSEGETALHWSTYSNNVYLLSFDFIP